MERRDHFTHDDRICLTSFGPWLKQSESDPIPALLTLSTDTWDFFSMVKNVAIIGLILRDTCWSWDTWMHGFVWKMSGFEQFFDLAHYRNQMLRGRDRGDARDNMHMGVPYHTYVANNLLTDPYLLMALDQYRNYHPG
jgi:hypothetical protein